MKKLRLGMFILLVLTLAISLVAIGCPAEEEEAPPKELKIGAIAGLSGPGSEALSRGGDGINAAADWINDKGGLTISGEKYLIKIIMEDCMMSVEGMVAAANKLVYDHQVKFIVGGVGVPPFKAAIESVIQPNKVLRIDTTGQGSEMDLNPDTPYTFVTTIDTAIHDPALDWLVETHPEVKKLALVCPEDPGVIVVMQNVRKEAEPRGLTVVSEEYYPFGTADFYPMWTKVLTAEPDVVVSGAGFPEWFGSMVKQGRELGFEGPMLFLTQGADPYVVRDIAGEYATDIFATSFAFKSPEMTPVIKEMVEITPDKFGREATFDDLASWEATWCLVQAIEGAQSLDPTVVKDYFEKMESIETPCGTGKMGGLETFGLNHAVARSWPLCSIMNGVVEHLMWFPTETP